MSHNFNSHDTATNKEQDELIGEALGKAIRHADRVCRREHIKADRIERVQHFCTSLRREIGYITEYSPSGVGYGGANKLPTATKNWLTQVLCDKALWHDIGVPTGVYGYNSYLSTEKVSNWLNIAKRSAHNANAQSESILADLEELERGLVPIKQQVVEAERINRESESLIGELCAVFN